MILRRNSRRRRTWTLPGLVTALALLCAAAPARAGEGCPGYGFILFCGNLNADCSVTASDGLVALKMAVNQIAKKDEADLSMDGNVTAVDSLRILRVAVGSLAATLSCAGQRGIAATSTGFYNEAGVRSSNGYAVGWYASGEGAELRNYLVFDLSSLDGSIVSGLLHLSTAPDAQEPYRSNDASETYTLFQIGTPVATLTNAGGVSAFTDLGGGVVHGTLVVNNSLAHVVDIPLNENGLNFLREHSGLVALGGAITTLTKGDTNEYIFNSTNVTNVRYLVLNVD